MLMAVVVDDGFASVRIRPYCRDKVCFTAKWEQCSLTSSMSLAVQYTSCLASANQMGCDVTNIDCCYCGV